MLGTRLNFVLKDLVPLGDIVPLLVPLFEEFKLGRQNGEGFGDWCRRLGTDAVRNMVGAAAPHA